MNRSYSIYITQGKCNVFPLEVNCVIKLHRLNRAVLCSVVKCLNQDIIHDLILSLNMIVLKYSPLAPPSSSHWYNVRWFYYDSSSWDSCMLHHTHHNGTSAAASLSSCPCSAHRIASSSLAYIAAHVVPFLRYYYILIFLVLSHRDSQFYMTLQYHRILILYWVFECCRYILRVINKTEADDDDDDDATLVMVEAWSTVKSKLSLLKILWSCLMSWRNNWKRWTRKRNMT